MKQPTQTTQAPQRISATELREHLGEVLDDVEEGEEFVVERRGEVVAHLVPPKRKTIQGVPYSSIRPLKLPPGEYEAFMAAIAEMRKGG